MAASRRVNGHCACSSWSYGAVGGRGKSGM